MVLGPIFSVELVTGARRARHYVLRVVYCVALLVALVLSYLPSMTANGGAVANATADFFTVFAVMQVVAVLALGPAMAAGAVATERERRTIEYLFASPLSNAEILLGKLAAKTVQMAGLVLAGLPVLALAALLGGIAMEALAVVMVIAASTLVGLTMWGIAVSACAPRARDAIVRAYLVLFLLLAPPAVLSQCGPLPRYFGWLEWLNGQLVAANPLRVLSYAFSAASSRDAAAAFSMVGSMVRNQLLGAAAAMVVAVLVVRRLHLKQAGAAPRPRSRRFQLIRPHIGNQAMLWKELFAETAAVRIGSIARAVFAVTFVVAVGLDLCIFSAWLSDGQSPVPEEHVWHGVGIAFALGIVGAMAAGVRGAVSITGERDRGCWDGILTSPLGPAEIVFAKILGCIWAMRGVVVMQVLLLAPVLVSASVTREPLMLIWFGVLLMVCWGAAVFASTLGVATSLRAKTTAQSLAVTLSILGTCILFSGCCCYGFGLVVAVGWILLFVLTITDFERISGRTHFWPGALRPGSPFRPSSPFRPDVPFESPPPVAAEEVAVEEERQS